MMAVYNHSGQFPTTMMPRQIQQQNFLEQCLSFFPRENMLFPKNFTSILLQIFKEVKEGIFF